MDRLYINECFSFCFGLRVTSIWMQRTGGILVKKKIWIPIAAVILLAVLFVPIPTGHYKDGGTKEYTALTYKIVNWKRITGDSVYDKT